MIIVGKTIHLYNIVLSYYSIVNYYDNFIIINLIHNYHNLELDNNLKLFYNVNP